MKVGRINRMHSLCACLLCVMTFGLSSCVDDNDDWWNPPQGYDYIDNRLTGYWALVQYNSENVSAADANYMYFNGNGYGTYYYLENGYNERESLRYWCQNSNTGASNFQINIQYQYGGASTMSYWFTHGDNTLWMQWRTSGGRVQTYVYDRVYRAPW
ncbi:MAG: hypothetical protein NC204_04220 [Candidatus Amulumruptor caecigallinarius]|nr:hypothetical protein [Candidatus Amulumruptor caecigallinarius]